MSRYRILLPFSFHCYRNPDPTCRRIVLIADGAHWIWEEAATHLRVPGKGWFEILDFYHASEHIWNMAHAAWPNDTPAAKAWADTTLHRLRHDGGQALEDQWQALPTALGVEAQATIDREQAYFAYHADRIDYPRYHAMGLPIGSGIIESACKTVLQQREIGSGMRWKPGSKRLPLFARVTARRIGTLYGRKTL